IERINKESTILQIKLTGGNVEKLADFLNALTKEYIETELEKKNLVSIRTIDFIDNELKGISDSLYLSEKELQEFKSRNGMLSLDEESKQIFELLDKLQD